MDRCRPSHELQITGAQVSSVLRLRSDIWSIWWSSSQLLINTVCGFNGDGSAAEETYACLQAACTNALASHCPVSAFSLHV